jgi:hypothetical protein
MPLGHRTYLDAKAKGENSLFGKAGCREATKRSARRDPDGMVKAGLPCVVLFDVVSLAQ